MMNYFSEVNEDIVDFEKGLLESEISYQNIVMESMNEEAIILLSEEADSDNKQQSTVVNFFQKILEWFKELGKKIGKFIQDVLKKARVYYIKAYNWFKVKMRTMTGLDKNEKIQYRTLYKWKNGVFPDLTDVTNIIFSSRDSIESMEKVVASLDDLYEDKKLNGDIHIKCTIGMLEINIKEGPKVIENLQKAMEGFQDDINLVQDDIKKAISAAKKENDPSKLKENKDQFTANKKLIAARNKFLSRSVSVVNDVVKDSIKIAKTVVKDNITGE